MRPTIPEADAAAERGHLDMKTESRLVPRSQDDASPFHEFYRGTEPKPGGLNPALPASGGGLELEHPG